MACSTCTSGSCSTSTGSVGCGKKGGCASGGCNKLNVFDWLVDMDNATLQLFDVVEVRFKGTRKEFFRNAHQLELYTGDPVIVDTGMGFHLGFVSLQGELVRLQMNKKNVKNSNDIMPIVRKAHTRDIEKYEQAKKREAPTLFRTRQVVQELKLTMKIADVEFQGDNSKAIFYYSAEERVDFRELIKILASEFKVRVEMKQITLRHEAGQIGGIGICGRELCCSTWLTDFKTVTTGAARYQNLSLNPAKLSGQCGRLKCCLNYELETYVEAMKDVPEVKDPLLTNQGDAHLQKTDVFRKLMWFSIGGDVNWVSLSFERVIHVIELNKKGEKPDTLIEDKIQEKSLSSANADLIKMDEKYKKKSKNKNKNRNRNKNQNKK